MPNYQLSVPLPYSAVKQFLITFTGVLGENYVIWKPENATFWLAALRVRSNIAADLNVCDSDPSLPIAFQSMSGTGYDDVFLGGGTIRSVNPSNSRLILLDPVGVAMRIKGVAYGWEVTPEEVIR